MADLNLYMHLSCFPNNEEQELYRVIALDRSSLARKLNNVYCICKSWQSQPRAFESFQVGLLRQVCDRHGIQFCAWREAWVSWPGDAEAEGNPVGSEFCHFDPDYYAQVISRVRGEADALGVPCGIDWEPYGNALNKAALKADLDATSLCRMRVAIKKAVESAGRVDAAYPTDGPRPARYSWPFAATTHKRCTSTATFRANSLAMLDEQKRRPEPPTGEIWEPNEWGLWVRPKDAPQTRTPRRLTVEQVLATDWTAIQAGLPSLDGGVLYCQGEDWSAVMAEDWGA
jgi:hypothetical protein